MSEHLLPLLSSLRSLDPTTALTLLSDWSKTACYDDARALIMAAAPNERVRLVTALRDTMSCYPTVWWGAPVVIHLRSDEERWHVLPALETAPFPGAVTWRWQSLDHGWLHIPEGNASGIETNRVEAALLLVRTASPEVPTIPDDWLAAAFRTLPEGTTVHISCRIVLPWIDAFEAAHALKQVALTGQPVAERQTVFLTDHAWAWCQDAGLAFRHFIEA